MSEVPEDGPPVPDEDDLSWVVDPDFVPDRHEATPEDEATPEEKRAREHPEETGS